MGKRNYVIHPPDELDGIRIASRNAALILDRLCRATRPGISTLELDRLGGQLIRDCGAESAFLNYHGFPAQICVSVNDQVVHGIGRADKIIQMGDLVSIDVGIRLGGYIGDTARTVSMGPPVGRVADLMAVAEKSLYAGIAAARPSNTVRDISESIHRVVTMAGFTVVRDFVGHGCGVKLHEPPEVPNYPAKKPSERLRSGMVLAVEPMVNMGKHKVHIDGDGWTVRTVDGSWSAHVEHMILITDAAPEILTCLKNV